MRRVWSGVIATIIAVSLAPPSSAQATGTEDERFWGFELNGGISKQAASSYDVTVQAGPGLEASGSAEFFSGAATVAARLFYFDSRRVWRLEVLRQELELEDDGPELASSPRADVDLLSFGLEWGDPALSGFVAVGPAFADAHGRTYLGDRFDSDYQLAGANVGGGIVGRLYLYGGFFVTGEAKITAVWLNLDLDDGGEIESTTVALHGLVGLGWMF